MPLAYFGYVLTSVPIDSILLSGHDMEFGDGTHVVKVKELFVANEVAIRNFAVALPALGTSILIKSRDLFTKPKTSGEKH
jgi:hypothetical protein